MKMKPDFGSVGISKIAAVLRVAGFFGLIAILAPAQAAYRLSKPAQPFLISLLFYRLLLKVLGSRVRVHGVMTTVSPTLFVSNHVSYLDIPVLGALIPAAFVAKADVRKWPMIGFLAEQQKTVFIERRSSRAGDHRNYLRERLETGQSLVLFPEGTSTDGMSVLPFKSSLFSVVEEIAGKRSVSVQPVSIACTQMDGLPLTRSLRPFYAWFGDMTLVGHLWNVFKFGHFTVDVTFHAPVTIGHFPDRKALASYCQLQVARGIEQCLTGRGVDVVGVPQLPAPRKQSLIGAPT